MSDNKCGCAVRVFLKSGGEVATKTLYCHKRTCKSCESKRAEKVAQSFMFGDAEVPCWYSEIPEEHVDGFRQWFRRNKRTGDMYLRIPQNDYSVIITTLPRDESMIPVQGIKDSIRKWMATQPKGKNISGSVKPRKCPVCGDEFPYRVHQCATCGTTDSFTRVKADEITTIPLTIDDVHKIMIEMGYIKTKHGLVMPKNKSNGVSSKEMLIKTLKVLQAYVENKENRAS